MPTESALMSSAAQARFRLQAPNSKPRAIKVVALDGPSERVVRRLAGGGWEHASFFTSAGAAEGPLDEARVSKDGWLSDLGGHVRSLTEEVATADLVVMVAAPGGHADAASLIGQACSLRRTNTTGFIVGALSASEEDLSKTLAQLRPWSLMLVIANADEYIDDMLIALRA